MTRPFVTQDGTTIDRATGQSSRPFIVGFAETPMPPPDLHCRHLPEPSATDPHCVTLHLVDARPTPRAVLTVSAARSWAEFLIRAADRAEAQHRRTG